MTRAKTELILVCPLELSVGDKNQSISPSAFYAEAKTASETTVDIDEPEHAATLLHEPVTDFDSELQSFLQSRVENFALSVTALNHFLEDPRVFLEVDLLRTPQAKIPSMVYGNAVHEALRQWGLKAMDGKSITKNQFIDAFSKYLSEKDILTSIERERLTALGQESLDRYFDERLVSATTSVQRVEFPITTHAGDIPIKGLIDRIDSVDIDSSSVIVTDYKTGRPRTEKQIRDDGDYWRQLVFYDLLIASKGLPIHPQEFVLDFVGERTEHPVERRFTVTESDRRELTSLIEAVWTKIQALDFTPL